MLKQKIQKTLESLVEHNLLSQCDDETLAFDISKQCVTEADVDQCLEAMLGHVSESELEAFLVLSDSEVYKRYLKALRDSMEVVDRRIYSTLKLLTESEGTA